MDAILRTTRLDENLEVDEAQRHEPEGESGHETREAHQTGDHHQVQPELGFTARHICRHLSLSL